MWRKIYWARSLISAYCVFLPARVRSLPAGRLPNCPGLIICLVFYLLRVTGSFGNGLSLYPVDIHEFRERFAKRDPIIMEILEGMYARGERVERFLRDVDRHAHVRACGGTSGKVLEEMTSGIRKVEKRIYKDYLIKAESFYRGMKTAYELSNWNSVGLEAVHCVISSNDALLAYFGGVRCILKDYTDAKQHLLDIITSEGAKKHAKHLGAVISQKNLIEYENRSFTRADANVIYDHADRFYLWVISMLPKHDNNKV